MSAYNLTLTFSSITKITQMFLDILIMWLLLYYAIKLVRNNARTVQIFKGIIFVIIINMVARLLGLTTVQFFADLFVNWGFLAIIIVFQPEIRQILERMGKSTIFSKLSNLTGNEKESLVDEVVKATTLLSQNQTGALISIEQGHPLNDFVSTGTPLNSTVTAELLTSIFVTTTPLHDGAVIIQGNSIACASAYFPPTNLELPSRFGARHRAAIGISEITDCITIVVSEETGTVSIATGGKIFAVDKRQLRDFLLREICGYTTEIKGIVMNDDVEHAKAVQELTEEQEKNERQILKQETSVLSKLSIRKQAKKVHKKIDAEEVITSKKKEPKKTVKKEEELDDEANNIKLPHHKKAAPVINYNEPKPEPVNKPVQEVKPQVIEEVKPVPYRTSSNVRVMGVNNPTNPETVERPVQTPARPVQTPVKPVEPVQPKPVENKPVQPQPMNSTSKPLNTDDIDVSKLMGFGNDLENTFNMLDHTKPTSSKKGGSR